MSDKISGFLDVLARLKLALGCSDDATVATRLGLSKTAFNNRKLRGSLPTDEIDTLIESEGLSAAFIYQGTGAVHMDSDAQSWEAGFKKRLKQSLSLKTYTDVLVSQGYKTAKLNAVANGKEDPPPRLLRDLQVLFGIDTNWLVMGDTSSSLSGAERDLIDAYRKSPAAGQEFIRRAAGMAATTPPKPTKVKQVASGSAPTIQVGGSVRDSKVKIGK